MVDGALVLKGDRPKWTWCECPTVIGADVAVRARVESLDPVQNEMSIYLRRNGTNGVVTLGVNRSAKHFWGGALMYCE